MLSPPKTRFTWFYVDYWIRCVNNTALQMEKMRIFIRLIDLICYQGWSSTLKLLAEDKPQ